MNRKFKGTAFVWKNNLFFNIANLFTVTSFQFNVSLLSKSITFLKKKRIDPKPLDGRVQYVAHI